MLVLARFLLCFGQPHSLKGTGHFLYQSAQFNLVPSVVCHQIYFCKNYYHYFNFDARSTMMYSSDVQCTAWRTPVVYRILIFLSPFLRIWDHLKSLYLVFQTLAFTITAFNFLVLHRMIKALEQFQFRKILFMKI